jgi:hypothetical protein
MLTHDRRFLSQTLLVEKRQMRANEPQRPGENNDSPGGMGEDEVAEGAGRPA